MALVTQEDLFNPAYDGPGWHRQVARDLAARLTPPSAFPCTFSQNAFRRTLLRFIFVEDLSDPARARARAELSAYVAEARDWDGQVNRAHPLVVAFSKAAADVGDIAAYHAIGWTVLQDWHDHDPAPWPGQVASDPDAPFWSFAFDGMQLFINMSNPAHTQRKSRNLGEHMLFIVNPRERFDIVAGDTPEGRRVRRAIRDRAAAYDGIPHAPELGSYQAGEIEWWQYGISDDNAPRRDRCPLQMRKK